MMSKNYPSTKAGQLHCWAPISAAISPGHSQLFGPSVNGCQGGMGTLKTNAGELGGQYDCDLIWLGGDQILWEGGQSTNCNWQPTGPGKGIWTYQLI
jgi:hypothetical protein